MYNGVEDMFLQNSRGMSARTEAGAGKAGLIISL